MRSLKYSTSVVTTAFIHFLPSGSISVIELHLLNQVDHNGAHLRFRLYCPLLLEVLEFFLNKRAQQMIGSGFHLGSQSVGCLLSKENILPTVHRLKRVNLFDNEGVVLRRQKERTSTSTLRCTFLRALQVFVRGTVEHSQLL